MGQEEKRLVTGFLCTILLPSLPSRAEGQPCLAGCIQLAGHVKAEANSWARLEFPPPGLQRPVEGAANPPSFELPSLTAQPVCGLFLMLTNSSLLPAGSWCRVPPWPKPHLAEGEHSLLGSHHTAFQHDEVIGHFTVVDKATLGKSKTIRSANITRDPSGLGCPQPPQGMISEGRQQGIFLQPDSGTVSALVPEPHHQTAGPETPLLSSHPNQWADDRPFIGNRAGCYAGTSN